MSEAFNLGYLLGLGKEARDAGCPGAKIRSGGEGRGMGFGKGKGPVGSPGKKRDWAKMLGKQRQRRGD
jgi:hypothetical protein